MSGVAGRSGGRNRKPTALKVLQGNPGKRPLPAQEPRPPVGIPPPPKWLTQAGRKHWRSFTRSVPPGVMTHADGLAAALCCQALASYIEYRDAGNWRAENSFAKFTLTLLQEFGMTPASRPRVHALPVQERDEFEELRKRSDWKDLL